MTPSRILYARSEAQQPAYLRDGTHVILPRAAFYEVLRALEDARDDARLIESLPEGQRPQCRARAEAIAEATDILVRHGRNCGVY